MKNRTWWFCLAALAPWLLACGSLLAQTNVPVAGIFQFSSSSYATSETESTPALLRDTPGALVTVVRTGGALGKMMVNYVITNTVSTNANIAWAGTNYLATNSLGGYNGTNGTLIFNDFQMSADIIIPIKDDTKTNAPRLFLVQLLGAQPAPDEDPSLVPLLGTSTNATVRIVDNDTGINFTRLFYRINEDGSNATVTVLYTTPDPSKPFSPFTVQIRTTRPAFYEPGSVDAVAGADFVAVDPNNSTLNFDPQNPQQSFTLTILSNATPGFNKAIGLELYGASSIPTEVVTNETQTIDIGGEQVTTNVLVTNLVDLPVPVGPVGLATLTIMSQGLPAGSVDPGYNPELDPHTTPPVNALPGANNTVYALVLQTNNQAIIGGDFSAVNTMPRARLARVNADGSTDPTFTVGTGADGYVDAINLTGSGKIYIGGGFTSFNGQQRNYVAKLNYDGSLDNSFLPGANVNGPVRALASYVSGNVEYLLIGGDFTLVQGVPRNSIARLLADGTIDASFDPGMGASGPVYSILRQEDGRILVGGDFTSFNGKDYSSLVRLNANGSLDATFSGSVGADGPVYSLARRTASTVNVSRTSMSGNGDTNDVQVGASAGSIQLTFIFYGSTNDTTMTNSIAINYDGRGIFTNNNLAVGTNNVRFDLPSTVFGPGNSSSIQIVVNGGIADGMGSAWTYNGRIIPQIPDAGQIIVGGGFSAYNGELRNGIARLNVDGSLDDTFDPGSGVDNAVYSICLAPNNGYYIAGLFTSYNGTRRMGLARILTDGKLDTTFLDTTYNQYAGMVRTSTMDPLPFINVVAVQKDGGLLIGGNFQRLGGDRSPGYVNALSTPPLQAIYSRSSIVTRQNYARLLSGATPGPGLVEIAQDEYFVDENAGNGTITLTRTNGSFGPATLGYKTLDGTAVAGVNYVRVDSTNTWGNGTIGPVPVSIGIIDDNILNGDMTFYIVASLPLNVQMVAGLPVPLGTALGRNRALMTIVESAKIPSFLSFSDANYRVDENGGQAVITVIRTGNLSSRVTVDYATKRATNGVPAEPDINFISRRGTLSFEPGQTEKTFSVTIIDNSIIEPDKTVALLLSNPRPQYVSLGAIPSAALTITDNDFAPGKIIFGDFNFVAAENQTNAVISVLRVGGNLGQASVQYLTRDGTALDGTHYLGTSGIFSWANGDSSIRSFDVRLIDDQVVDGDHTVQLMLTNFVNALAGTPSNVVLNITESDSYGRLEFNVTNLMVNENEGGLIVNVVRKDGAVGAVSVDCVTVNGTAVAGINFVGATNTLAFAPGQINASFNQQILDDGRATPNKLFRLRLQNPVGASIGALSNATVTILDRQSYNMPPGQLDNVFNPDAGADNFIFAMALQTNGNLVISGDFGRVNGVPRNRVAQLSTNGVIDTDFGLGSGVNGSVRALTIQADGRIIIGGAFTVVDSINRNSIARLTSNGSLDATFNPGSGAQNPVYALAVQKDGRILAGGDFASFNGLDRRGVVRLDANGFVDPTFNPGSGANGTVYALAIQPDGKILVAGQFTQFNGVPQAGYARLNLDGSLDAFFNSDVGANGNVRAIAVQLDGKILLGGQFTSVNGVMANRLARLNTDGTWDATFNMGEGADNPVYTILLQPDGKPLVAGDFGMFNGVTRGRLVRLNRDGSLDPTINFGTGANGFVAALAVQTDRKIVLGGGFSKFNEEPRANLARIYGGGIPGAGGVEFTAAQYVVSEGVTNAVVTVRRVGGTQGDITVDFHTQDSAGLEGSAYRGVTNTLVFKEGEIRQTVTIPIIDNLQLDPDRNVDLILTNVTGGATLGPQPVAILTIKDNDTIVGFSSTYYTIDESDPAASVTILVTRLGDTTKTATVNYATAGGTAVAGVNYTAVSGSLIFAPGETNKAFLIPIIHDFVAAGNKTVALQLSNLTGGTLLNPNSAMLTIIENDFSPGQISFVQSSYSVVESGTNAFITVVRANGASGTVSVDFSTTTGGTAPAGSRYAATNGTLTFGDGETSKFFYVRVFDDLIRQGAQTVNLRLSNPKGGALGTLISAVLTILDDDVGPGSLDTNFNAGSNLGTVYAMGLQTDGRIVAVGRYTRTSGTNLTVYGTARLNVTGSLDSSYTFGAVLNDVYAVQIKTNGGAAIGGAFQAVGTVARRYAGQLTTSGQGDSTFNLSANENGLVRAVAVQKDNKVIIGGEFSAPVSGIARLNSDGSLDVSFNPEGGTDAAVNVLTLQADEKILVGGRFSRIGNVGYRALARLLPTGQIDPSFTVSQNLWRNDASAEVKAIYVQADGKILIGGKFIATYQTTNQTRYAYQLLRLNSNGSVDDLFIRNLTAISGGSATVQTIAMQPDGKIYIGGSFTSVGTNYYNNVARLNGDGTFDTTFFVGDGANGTVYDLVVQGDGKLLVGGSFTRLNGNSRLGIGRLLGDDPVQGIFADLLATPQGVKVILNVLPGNTYILQGSANLIDWVNLATNKADSAAWTYTDTNAPGRSQRFFRALK